MPTLNTPEKWLSDFPRPAPDGHKYERGHVAVLGAPELTGATRLAASAASRIGAGLVSVLSHEQAPVYRASLPPDIMVTSRPLGALNRVTTLLAGPGGFEASRVAELAALPETVARVLDADALRLVLEAGVLQGPVVLTPHEGEFARLFPDLEGTRVARAISAAAEVKAIIVLKGQDTVIAAPDGQVICNQHAGPYLAKAGTGDVLAGMIAGLIAQGMPALEAASAAVWMHGEASLMIGPGLVAGDLVDALRQVLARLLS